MPFPGTSPSGHQGIRCVFFQCSDFQIRQVVVHCGSFWVLQVTLPAGSTIFPLKLLPDHKNWHFLIFLNDDINNLLFLFTLSETFGKAFLFLFPSSGCFPGTHNPLSWTRSLLSAQAACRGMDWSEQSEQPTSSRASFLHSAKNRFEMAKLCHKEPGWQHLSQPVRDRLHLGQSWRNGCPTPASPSTANVTSI